MKVKVNEEDLSFKALNAIDTVTNLLKLVRIENSESIHVVMNFVAQC